MKALLERINSSFPYAKFMGFELTLSDKQELVAKMPFQDKLVGNPLLPALHGGGVAGFMEATALASLIWAKAQSNEDVAFQFFPKTINITSDYLRPGLTKDSFAQAHIHRMGRRYASVHVLAWQDEVKEPIAEAVGHFLIADWKGK